MTTFMPFQEDDGGRAAAGFKGVAGDCVTRAVSIASGRSYAEVYKAMAEVNAGYRGRSRTAKKSRGVRSANNGVWTQAEGFKRLMRSWGFEWTPTMKVGQGCKTHLLAEELPAGRLVVHVAKHCTAVIDGVIHDTYDPNDREAWVLNGVAEVPGPRCVYGYWRLA